MSGHRFIGISSVRAMRAGLSHAFLAAIAICSPVLHGQDPRRPSGGVAIRSRTAVANGVTLHYLIAGAGSPVVLLHGFPETSYAWRHIMPVLARDHTAIAPDLPGIGVSKKPVAGYDTNAMAQTIRALVLQLGFKRIDLVGHDVGAAVAYAYASTHRDEVAHLSLFDVPPQGTEAFRKLATKAWNFGFQSLPVMPERLVSGRERTYIVDGFYKPMSFGFEAFTPADIDAYVHAYQAPGTMHAAFEWYRHFGEDIAQNTPQLKIKLEMPVLMLGGAQSGGPLMQETANEIAVHGEVEIIQNCGHWLADEKPDEVLRYLIPFLAK